jgi:hypothetical protein
MGSGRSTRYGGPVPYDLGGVGKHLDDALAVLGLVSLVHDPLVVAVGEGLGVLGEEGFEALEELLAALVRIGVLIALAWSTSEDGACGCRGLHWDSELDERDQERLSREPVAPGWSQPRDERPRRW